MRHRLFIPAATALLFALAACTQDELAGDNRLPEGEYPVVIRATGLSVEATPLAAPSTRATVDGDWQGVTSVALKMGDAVKEYTVTASTDFKSATLSRENDPYYWTSRDPITVSAWWPFNNVNITQMPAVKVAEDQSKLADFQNSDFISAENRKVEFNTPTLEFTHRTARVTIELKPGTGFTSVAGATVSLVSLSADNGNPTAIKTYNASGNTYEALTAPQTVAAGKPFVKVELGGGTFYFRPQNNVVLEAGSRYKYTVKVNATGLTLEGCTIGDWADGGGESGAAELGYIYDSNTNTYTVYNADGLLAWNEAAQKDRSINCTLTADIDLTGKDWSPIGTNFYNSYTGTFDGGGHTIMGLTVTTNDQYVGLFGRLGKAGTVKNVVMDGIQITCNHRLGYAGGVAGFSWGGTIENCSVSGSVSGTICAGGVVGIQWEASITGCSSSATVKGMVQVGGVAGETNSGATMAACYATGNVTIEIDPINNILGGGLVGFNAGSSVLACYATGNVTSTGSSTGNVYIGGFLGGNYTTVTACYWKNNHEQGIGYNKEGIAPEATNVDGTNVTWENAVDAMNTALQKAGSEWRYELKGALPTLRKQ
ncbi:fimbrillin family protein [Alistipes onderdonkii]|uniref:Fimbrillin family protein n=1 Tax=Alistipes onderdonkii TaxID=328813 RepID=A0A5B3GNF6_9BACT|nr:fimbrillin family protein [Alistipes onderdonkii]KAA2374990.1 fimbrillin family protein [Alistipes onderdonkii]KAA2377475.1 fimbrillin family protein [Alistipes onderdonkii]KAA2385736.1 fimbrillin family protein [Alistipes onderdonkii]KAA2386264.1 fimbrillin family protein [Alistipes onderdonkii]KAA2390665.1 fimbrillin family protein [Alistipes onderdonkii]